MNSDSTEVQLPDGLWEELVRTADLLQAVVRSIEEMLVSCQTHAPLDVRQYYGRYIDDLYPS